MTKYYIIIMNGLQGVRRYTTETEAQADADRHNALTGRKVWTVREIIVRNVAPRLHAAGVADLRPRF